MKPNNLTKILSDAGYDASEINTLYERHDVGIFAYHPTESEKNREWRYFGLYQEAYEMLSEKDPKFKGKHHLHLAEMLRDMDYSLFKQSLDQSERIDKLKAEMDDISEQNIKRLKSMMDDRNSITFDVSRLEKRIEDLNFLFYLFIGLWVFSLIAYAVILNTYIRP